MSRIFGLVFGAAVLAACDAGTAEPRQATLAVGERFACTPTHLWDGDGPIRCAEGPKVRLAGIAARELDGTCRPGHPCPPADAGRARAHLAYLLGWEQAADGLILDKSGHVTLTGPTLTCTSNGSAGGDRIAAWCVSPVHGDLSCAMVKAGMAAKWDRHWRDHRC